MEGDPLSLDVCVVRHENGFSYQEITPARESKMIAIFIVKERLCQLSLLSEPAWPSKSPLSTLAATEDRIQGPWSPKPTHSGKMQVHALQQATDSHPMRTIF